MSRCPWARRPHPDRPPPPPSVCECVGEWVNVSQQHDINEDHLPTRKQQRNQWPYPGFRWRFIGGGATATLNRSQPAVSEPSGQRCPSGAGGVWDSGAERSVLCVCRPKEPCQGLWELEMISAHPAHHAHTHMHALAHTHTHSHSPPPPPTITHFLVQTFGFMRR